MLFHARCCFNEIYTVKPISSKIFPDRVKERAGGIFYWKNLISDVVRLIDDTSRTTFVNNAMEKSRLS
jgi:hypothetical protein